MTPEDSQKITHLQQRILTNLQAGKNAHEGISPEDLAESLAVLRQNRVVASARGGKAAAAKKGKAPKQSETAAEAGLASKLGDFDLG